MSHYSPAVPVLPHQHEADLIIDTAARPLLIVPLLISVAIALWQCPSSAVNGNWGVVECSRRWLKSPCCPECQRKVWGAARLTD